jgi:uncharacterized heparinase superfamily protein
MTDDARLSGLVDPAKLPLLYHTARNMHVRQLTGVAERKLRHAVVPRLPVDFDARYERQVPAETTATPAPLAANTATLRAALPDSLRATYRERATEVAAGAVTFAGHTVQVEDDAGGVDWFGSGVTEPPALYALKLRGFEFLRYLYLGHDAPDECPDAVEAARRWTESWAESEATRVGEPGYLRGAWTPHSVSLRLLNWARFYAWADLETHDREFAALVRHQLWKNARVLENHVEYDLGGNHLIENGAGLAVAGAFLDDDDLWDHAVRVLVDAADQFLADGGHFELSPMYHVLTLTRYLTVLDLCRETGRTVPGAVRRVATEGTRFLAAVAGPDGRIPLLNDSVYGEALPADACRRYAEAVGVDPDVVAGRESDPAALEPSGLYWLGSDEDRLLFDGGPVGPPHLPAHSHDDLLAVSLWVDGRPVLTDTGTKSYVAGPARQHARSVAAHNTVQYGDVEPIPVGGSFLMGRRVTPTVRAGGDEGVDWVEGTYRREGDAGEGYRHRRRVFCGGESDASWWLVWDRVTAEASRPVRSRLHVAPGLEVSADTAGDAPEGALVVRPVDTAADTALAHLVPVGAEDVHVGWSPSYPAFGRERERPSVTLRADGRDVSMGVLVSTRPLHSVGVGRERGTASELRVDGSVTRLPRVGPAGE